MKLFTIILLALLLVGQSDAITKTPWATINTTQPFPTTLDMGTNKITRLGAPTTDGDATRFQDLYTKINKTDIGTYIAGTIGYIPVFTGANAIAGNSPVSVSGSDINVSGAINAESYLQMTGIGTQTAPAADAIKIYSKSGVPVYRNASGEYSIAGGTLTLTGGDFYADGHIPMTGNLAMGGYKGTGAANATASQDLVTYSQQQAALSEYVFRGYTESELHTFIDTYGSGTYTLAAPITIDSTLTIDQDFVIIRAQGSTPSIYAATSGGYFNIDMDSGLAINVTGSNVELDHLCFHVQNDTSMVDIMQFVDCWGDYLNNVKIYNSKGTAITFESGSRMQHVDDIAFESNTAHYGTFMCLKDTLNGAALHPLDTYIRDVVGVDAALVFDLQSCEGVYFRDIEVYACDSGIKFNPAAANSVMNIVMDFVNLDTCGNGGTCLDSTGAYQVYQIVANQLWLYTDTGGAKAMALSNVQNMSISNSYFGGASVNNQLYIGSTCQDIDITGGSVTTTTSAATGIYVDGADNVILNGIRVRNPSDGYSIVMVAGSDRYVVTNNLVRTAVVGLNDSTHLNVDNVVVGAY